MPLSHLLDTSVGTQAAETRRQGKPRPVLDLMIAATALHHGLAVATLNARDFDGIPGLAVEDWSGPP